MDTIQINDLVIGNGDAENYRRKDKIEFLTKISACSADPDGNKIAVAQK